jgi:predicted dinucleotide-binding enzyme
VLGALLIAAGVLGLGAVLLHQVALSNERAGLELHLAALDRASGRSTLARDAANAQAAQKTVTELATPWSQLLVELEQAGADTRDKVAVLTVEPDHVKHRVKVAAEARTLSLALAYVERLRKSQVLRYPMLDSHEVKSDDNEHPVHFELSAEWSDRT